ncbi:MAG: hypothetical protein ACI4S9_06505, partial [Christensenellales bacterium]
KDNDVRLGGHEIWNEPDYGVFFNGSWLDYIDMYIYGARGIRNANPDALVGGVSAAFIDQCCNKKVTEFEDGTKTDFERFVERSAAADMLPDFVSWHYYGRGGVMEGLSSDAHNFSDYRYSVMNALEALQNGTDENVSGAYPELETVQQHLNEFNIYAPAGDEIYRTTGMIPGMFSAIDTILNANDITRATWAGLLCEWQNELSYDMIDTVSLQRYPSYHVLWMYGRLPIDRVKQTAIDNIGTLAGIDDGRAGIIAYNKDSVNRSKKISVGNVPFDSADVTVYLVDDNHFTYATKNEPQIVAEMKNVNPNGLAFNLDFNGNSVYYIEINDAKAKSDTEIMRPLSNNVVKKEYWYPKRGDNTPYSDIHENSLTAHLSMNNNVSGASAMSVIMDDMQGVGTLKVGYETWGTFKRTDTSALGIKVDYQTSDGYTKSVYYYYDDYGYDVILPFGTKRTADLSESFGSGTEGEFEIALEENAPEGWTGRICVNYLIKDSGSTSTAKFIIK